MVLQMPVYGTCARVVSPCTDLARATRPAHAFAIVSRRRVAIRSDPERREREPDEHVRNRRHLSLCV